LPASLQARGKDAVAGLWGPETLCDPVRDVTARRRARRASRLIGNDVVVQIRRVRKDEWRALRDVRLRALAEAPDAFETRYDEAVRRPEAWWVDWAARSSAGTQAMFLAWDGEEAVGIAGTYVEDNGDRWLISMWVDPAARGCGVGSELVEAVAGLARNAGWTELLLEVTDGNAAARRLYERCGFVGLAGRRMRRAL
jgi:GNAT superfamily N-acetyltransferase